MDADNARLIARETEDFRRQGQSNKKTKIQFKFAMKFPKVRFFCMITIFTPPFQHVIKDWNLNDTFWDGLKVTLHLFTYEKLKRSQT